MSFKFQLVAGHLALDFANTLDYRFDPKRRVELLKDYGSVLEFVQQSGVITRRQARLRLLQTRNAEGRVTLRHAIELREAIDSLARSIVLGVSPRGSCLKTLNSFLKNAQATECLVWRRSEFVRTYTNRAATPSAPLGPIIEAAAELLTSPQRHSIRECADPSCRWLFLDHSKNHSRRWCDMRTCGNRWKVQRFRARQ
jgi:predicted RNA-binding Zn ribbon-like protein